MYLDPQRPVVTHGTVFYRQPAPGNLQHYFLGDVCFIYLSLSTSLQRSIVIFECSVKARRVSPVSKKNLGAVLK